MYLEWNNVELKQFPTHQSHIFVASFHVFCGVSWECPFDWNDFHICCTDKVFRLYAFSGVYAKLQVD